MGRTLRGFTKKELAAAAHLSPRSISDFEGGMATPSATSLRDIARALRLPEQFFAGSDPIEIPPESASFRALTRMTARQRDQAIASAQLSVELASWIEQRFDLPAADIPQFPGVDPDTAAEAVRSAWGLGELSISNMIHLLEAHGVRVFSLIEECHEIDAFSWWKGQTPFVVFNTTKSSEHGRFDAAHELGHLVLHHDPVACLHDRQAERQAQEFASAFLMPERSVKAAVPVNPSLWDLIETKHRWRVSVAALTFRMHRLGLLSDWHYGSLFKTMGRYGYLVDEPESDPRETSQVLAKVLQMLRSRYIGVADIASSLNVSVRLIHRLLFGLTLTPLDGGGVSEARSGRPPLFAV